MLRRNRYCNVVIILDSRVCNNYCSRYNFPLRNYTYTCPSMEISLYIRRQLIWNLLKFVECAGILRILVRIYLYSLMAYLFILILFIGLQQSFLILTNMKWFRYSWRLLSIRIISTSLSEERSHYNEERHLWTNASRALHNSKRGGWSWTSNWRRSSVHGMFCGCFVNIWSKVFWKD